MAVWSRVRCPSLQRRTSENNFRQHSVCNYLNLTFSCLYKHYKDLKPKVVMHLFHLVKLLWKQTLLYLLISAREEKGVSSYFAVSLCLFPFQGQYPGRESSPACWAHLLFCCLLLLALRLFFFRIFLQAQRIQIRLWRNYGHHLLWKMHPPVLLNAPLIQRWTE